MIQNWDKSFDLVIAHEGGFTNDVRDPGNKLPDGRAGCTMWGCTQANWETYVGRKVTQDDMRKLTKNDVKPLYKKNYWDVVSGDSLPAGLDYAMFDFAINAGAYRAKTLLQKALGVSADGQIGEKTLIAINNTSTPALIQKFSDAKTGFYKSLPTYGTYGKGWLTRIASVQKDAISMIG